MNKALSRNVKITLSLIFIFVALFMFLGCRNTYYNNDRALVNGKCLNNSKTLSSGLTIVDNGNSLTYRVKKLTGYEDLAQADVGSECETEIYFSIKADAGKGKLVLITPDSKVEVLKEIISRKESSYDGNIKVNCKPGANIIKFVGDGYGGNIKLTVGENSPFKYLTDNIERSDDEMSEMFSEDFSF